MNVYISADMEGISGVVMPGHVVGGKRDYGRFRKLMTAEVNAAIEGALAGGAKRIIVNDAHRLNDNILIEELHPAAELISGVPKRLSMMQGINHEIDAVFMIGYHAMSGAGCGILCHSWTSQVAALELNGQVVGETGFNAALAGAFDVPVALVTGDRQTTEEARSVLGEIETVAVKEGYSQAAARCLHPQVAAEKIKAAAERALKLKVKPFQVTSPVKARATFTKPLYADLAELVPGSHRLDGTTIEWTGEDMITVYPALQAMMLLSMLDQLL